VTRSLSSLLLRNTRPTSSVADPEATLDIELASSVAPGAPIYVYFSGLDAVSILAALGQAVDDAQALNAVADGTAGKPFLSALSMSFSACDAFLTQADIRAWDTLFSALTLGGVTIFAASGDTGAAGCAAPGSVLQIQAAGFPATSPLVTAVGGTALTPDSAGNRTQETAWAKAAPFTMQSSGGGKSRVYVRPPWQQALSVVPDNARLVPDVSLTASTVDLYVNGLDVPGGGTSASSPLWAGIIALINQQRVQTESYRQPIGFLNAKLPELGPTSAFRDIADGRTNDWTDGAGNVLVAGYAAGTGYDLVTGWGVPDVQALATALLNQPQQRPGTAGIVSGNNQTGTAGQALAPFVIELKRADGSPVAGFTVLFYDPLGNYYSADTDSAGKASFAYTIPAEVCGGASSCSFEVLAIASGFLNSPLAFVVNPPTGTPAQVIKVSGDNQRTPINTSFPFPLKVRVVDAVGNGVAKVPVNFGGSGVVAPSAQTDGNGYASTTVAAGATPGTIQITAVAGGLSAVFSETVLSSVPGADLQVSTGQISLSTQVNHAVSQTLAVANVGDLGVSVAAAAAPSSTFLLTRIKPDGTCDYLTISAGLTLSDRLTTICVVGNADGKLPAGSYTGLLTVTAASGTNKTAEVQLKLEVRPLTAPPEIALYPASFNLTVLAGTNPPTQPVTVTNLGSGRLNWTATVTVGGGWLSVAPTQGRQGDSFTITISSSALA